MSGQIEYAGSPDVYRLPSGHDAGHTSPGYHRGFSLRFLIFISLLLSALPAFAELDPRPRGDEAGLQAALDDLRVKHDLPGLAVAIFTNEQRHVFTSSADAGITPDTRFRLGSVSELFVSLAVLSLVNDGSLALDDTVLERAPELDLRNQWSAERPITISDLLTHQSGLASPHFRDTVMLGERQALLAAINRSFQRAETGFLPGSRWRHSILNTAVAIYLVEKTANARLQDIIDILFNVPLETRLALETPGNAQDHAAAHVDGRIISPLPLNLAPTDNGWASAADLGRIGQLLLNEGRVGDRPILSNTLIEQLETAADPLGMQGHGVRIEYPGGHRQFVLRGNLPGYQSLFAWLPERSGGFVALVNQGGNADVLADLENLLRGQLPRTMPASGLAAGNPPPVGLAGWYRPALTMAPPVRWIEAALGWLRLTECGDSLCARAAGANGARLQQPDHAGNPGSENADSENNVLRITGSWHTGWQPTWYWNETPDGIDLFAGDNHWQKGSVFRVLAPLASVLALLVVSLFAVMQLAQLPRLAWQLRRRQLSWLQLLPAELATLAVVAALAVPVIFLLADLPQLAQRTPLSIGLLVASIAAPLLGTLAVPAYMVALQRKHLYAPISTGISLVAALGWSVMLLLYEAVAFQSWNY